MSENLKPFRRASTLASRQSGLLTRKQALECGLSRTQVEYLLTTSRWERLSTGVYRVAGAPGTHEQRVWAACLETNGLASHRTAAWFWNLDGVGRRPPEPIEVAVPFASKRTSDLALVRRSRSLLPSHAAKRAGVPRTNLARTVIDLAEVLDPPGLELAFDAALRQQPDLRHWVQRLVRSMGASGRRGMGNLKPLLGERSVALDSALEVKVRRLIRAARLPAPRAGVDVVEGGLHVARLDFAWPENRPRVALMAHGARWHGNTRRWQRDLAQASQLAGLGWRVVQCSAADIDERPDEVVRNLKRALAGFEADAEVGGIVQH